MIVVVDVQQAVKILKDIEQRLKGLNSKNRIMIPLSIEGQVHKLITVSNQTNSLLRQAFLTAVEEQTSSERLGTPCYTGYQN